MIPFGGGTFRSLVEDERPAQEYVVARPEDEGEPDSSVVVFPVLLLRRSQVLIGLLAEMRSALDEFQTSVHR